MPVKRSRQSQAAFGRVIRSRPVVGDHLASLSTGHPSGRDQYEEGGLPSPLHLPQAQGEGQVAAMQSGAPYAAIQPTQPWRGEARLSNVSPPSPRSTHRSSGHSQPPPCAPFHLPRWEAWPMEGRGTTQQCLPSRSTQRSQEPEHSPPSLCSFPPARDGRPGQAAGRLAWPPISAPVPDPAPARASLGSPAPVGTSGRGHCPSASTRACCSPAGARYGPPRGA